MMAGEDRVGQVIEAPLASHAPVALAVSLPLIKAMPRHFSTPAPRAAHAVGPAQMPDRVEALGIIN
jgi:hypothetical protein